MMIIIIIIIMIMIMIMIIIIIIIITRDEPWGYVVSTSFQIVRCKLHRYANRLGCRLHATQPRKTP